MVDTEDVSDDALEEIAGRGLAFPTTPAAPGRFRC